MPSFISGKTWRSVATAAFLFCSVAVLGGVSALPAHASVPPSPPATPTPAPTQIIAPPGTTQVGLMQASGHDQFCVSNECLNAYGQGPSVKSNPKNALNNAFGVFRINGDCNGGYTSANCPMTGNPAGWQIVELVDEDGGLFQGNCIGDYGNSSTRADAGVNVACGGYGTVDVWYAPACGSGYDYFVNDKWSGYNWSSAREIGFLSNNSSQVYLNNLNFSCLQETAF